MSDENLNNNGNEETAALFVSAQKKKKAEEEARRRAEEEQAKREAAEAEVRRMEQEVEERKRKAEEERLALEAAEKAQQAEMQRLKAEKEKEAARIEAEARAKARAKAKAKEERAAAVANSASSFVEKLKNPRILAIIGGVLVVIIALIIVLVVVNGGKGKDDDDEKGSSRKARVEEEEDEPEYDESDQYMDSFGEYTPASADHQIRIIYPTEIYPDGPEESQDDAENKGDVRLAFTPADEEEASIDVFLGDISVFKEGQRMTKGTLGFISARSLLEGTKTGMMEDLEENYGGISLTEDTVSDPENDPYYGFRGTFTSAEGEYGAYEAWYQADNTGGYKRIAVVARMAEDDPDRLAGALNDFVENNRHDPLSTPGHNDPADTELDSLLEISDVHLGIPVPYERYERNPAVDGDYFMWSDDNGASILFAYAEDDGSTEQGAAMLSNMINEGANHYLKQDDTSFGERALTSQEVDEERGLLTVTATESFGGVSYWEKGRVSGWHDVQTDKNYLLYIVFIAPARSQAVYEEMFDNAIADLRDI